MIPTHIDLIKPGDTVQHQGRVVTVCGTDLKRDPFMGTTLFGDSYRCGHLPVQRVFPPFPTP